MPETIVPARSATAGSDEPQERECLRCYLDRMLVRHGCDNTRRWTVRWRDRRFPGDEQLLDELADRGGICCDCEVVINVWEGNESNGPRPACGGAGGREPLDLCAVWAGLSLRDADDYGDDEETDYYEESGYE